MKHLAFLFVLLAMVTQIYAEVPNLFNYSGKLTDKNNNVLPSGKYNMKFILWDHATSTDSSHKVWEEEHYYTNGVDIFGGGYNVVLGGLETLPDFDKPYWLEMIVSINGKDEKFNRQKMVSTPYAIRAEYANHSSGTVVYNSFFDLIGEYDPRQIVPVHIMYKKPQKVWLYLQSSKMSSIYYTEIGQHSHTVGIGAHNHTVNIGAHSHNITYHTTGLPWIEMSGPSSAVGNPNGVIHNTDLGTKTASTFDYGTKTSSAIGLMPAGRSLNTSAPMEFIEDLQIHLDGQLITANVITKVSDPNSWNGQLGNGTGSHPFVNGTGLVDITDVNGSNTWSVGTHTFSFFVHPGKKGGRIHYTVIIEY